MIKRSVVMLLAAATAVVGLSVPADAATATHTSVTMVGTGDYIAGSSAWYWRDGDGTITASGNENGIGVSVSGGSHGNGDYFSLSFAPPTGEALAVGTYTGAERTPFRSEGHPGIEVFGSGRGCNTVAGEFTVHSLAADFSSFWVTYDMHCEGGTASTFGEVRYNMPSDADVLVVPNRIDWPASGANQDARSVPVNVINTGASPITISAASITAGTAFRVASNGCTTLAVGASCVITVVFRPPAVASYSGELTITDSSASGSRVVPLTGDGLPVPVRTTTSLSKTVLKYGESVRVTAGLTGSYTNKQVSIYQKVGNAARSLVATKTVDSAGKASVVVAAKQKTVFSVEWAEGPASATSSATAKVYARIGAAMTRFKGRSGAYYTYARRTKIFVRAVVTPPKQGQCVRFKAQARLQGAWRTIAATGCVPMSSTGAALAYLPYEAALRGKYLRFQAEYAGDGLNLRTTSAFAYGKWV